VGCPCGRTWGAFSRRHGDLPAPHRQPLFSFPSLLRRYFDRISAPAGLQPPILIVWRWWIVNDSEFAPKRFGLGNHWRPSGVQIPGPAENSHFYWAQSRKSRIHQTQHIVPIATLDCCPVNARSVMRWPAAPTIRICIDVRLRVECDGRPKPPRIDGRPFVGMAWKIGWFEDFDTALPRPQCASIRNRRVH